jgi:hypothetical protein
VLCFDRTNWLLPASFEQLLEPPVVSIQFAIIGHTRSHGFSLTPRLCGAGLLTEITHPGYVMKIARVHGTLSGYVLSLLHTGQPLL